MAVAVAVDARKGIPPGRAATAVPASRLVSLDQQGGLGSAMPVAMAALDVAGQIRERSPADTAIFGDGATRLIDRFVQPADGQTLLARAASDGSAEATAWLMTAAGQQRFRISLWRQRGGERIRVMAAFSPYEATAHGTGGETMPESARAALIRMGNDMRSPLAAALGFAELIRSSAQELDPTEMAGHAADIVAAAWRLMRIVDDLEAAGTSGDVRPALKLAEVDIARLARRIARLAGPVAKAAAVTIDTGGLPGRGQGPSILGDESALWSIVDNLLQGAIRHAGRDAMVAIALRTNDGDLVLEVADNGAGLEAEDLARQLQNGNLQNEDPGRGLASVTEAVRVDGAMLEIDTAPGQGLTARIVFPAARCLSPI